MRSGDCTCLLCGCSVHSGAGHCQREAMRPCCCGHWMALGTLKQNERHSFQMQWSATSYVTDYMNVRQPSTPLEPAVRFQVPLRDVELKLGMTFCSTLLARGFPSFPRTCSPHQCSQCHHLPIMSSYNLGMQSRAASPKGPHVKVSHPTCLLGHIPSELLTGE